MTKIYNYDGRTKEYLGETTARIDPVDETPMVPRNATLVQPPAPEVDKIAVWSDPEWSVEVDYRGHEYWLADKSKHTINAIGENLPEGALSQMPEPTLEEAKAAAKVQIKSRHAALLRELTGDYSAEERDTWSMQLRWSQGYLADQNAAHAELLAGLIPEPARQSLPDPAQFMADKIASKDAQFAKLTVIANRTKAEANAAVDVAADQAALDIVLASLGGLETAALAEFAALNE